jgi:hypothetical protein
VSICPNCQRELKHLNQWHYCIKVDIDDLFKGKPAEIEVIFDKLLSEIVDWHNVIISATKNCIVFVHNKTFLVVRPMKNQLDIKFYSKKELNIFPIFKSVSKMIFILVFPLVSNIDELSSNIYSLIKKSYEIS